MVEDSESSTKSSRIIVERTGRLWGGHHHENDWDQMRQSESRDDDDDIRQVTTNVWQKLCGYLKEFITWDSAMSRGWAVVKFSLVVVAAAARNGDWSDDNRSAITATSGQRKRQMYVLFDHRRGFPGRS
jgi:hypothetical protein